ncbi:putative Short-chain dehydrogenase [Seiridium cardinale]|uniref:Short-chain dehydrogenase n=1 Tax=Seiridium cardinale TaxID=138064 RepID=A0ABR2X5U5_9PEZI
MPRFNVDTSSEEVIETFKSRVAGRIFLITGAGAQGLGGSTALYLSKAGPAHIILVSRTVRNVQPVVDQINTESPAVKVTLVQCDLSDQDSVRAAAATIDKAVQKIDVIINNAGVMAIRNYSKDKHGIELQLSANHVGHFLLTNLLVPKLVAAGDDSRVVNLSSHGHRISPFRFDDYNFSEGKEYERFSAYGQSKTANILFTVGLSERLRGKGVTSVAVHPGSIWGTGLADGDLTEEDVHGLTDIAERNTGRPWIGDVPFSKPMSQGTATTLIAALAPEIPSQSPAYLSNGQITEANDYAMDKGNADELWKLSEEWVGQKFDY